MKYLWLFYAALTLVHLVCGCNEGGPGSPVRAERAFRAEKYSGPTNYTGLSRAVSAVCSSDTNRRRATTSVLAATQFWPLETLRWIPGPVFLIVYLALGGICVGIGWIWIGADGTGSYHLPGLTRFDPLTIAALRGGWAAAIRTAVFSLWCKKLVEIAVLKSFWRRKEIEVESVRGPNGVLSPIENEVYNFLTAARRPKDLFQEGPLKSRVEQCLQPVYKELEELHLIPAKEQKQRVRRIAITMAGVVVVIGGAKLWLGFWNNKPLLYLSILLIASPIIVFTVLDWLGTPTRLGRRYLNTLKLHCEWLKEPVSLGRSPEGIDPAFSVAIFGVSVNKAFRKAFPLITFSSLAGSCGVGGCGGGGGGGCGGGGCGGCGG